MLQPKRTKFRREQKNRMKGNSGRGNQLAFGSFGLKNLENCWLTAHQIEAARQAISRSDLDSHLPREAFHCKAARYPYG